jgi:hypothetical protein
MIDLTQNTGQPNPIIEKPATPAFTSNLQRLTSLEEITAAFAPIENGMEEIQSTG